MTNREIRKEARENLNEKLGTSVLTFVLTGVVESVATVIPVIGNLLVEGPINVGLQKVYYKNTTSETPDWKELLSGFEDFGENFMLGLLKNIYIFLWSLLLVVPGIVKGYAYAMAEYLKVREPELTGNEAIRKSNELMEGRKMDLFLLDLSFMGWILLTVVTCGLAGFYVGPYILEAHTVFFNKVYDEYKNDRVVAPEFGMDMNAAA